MGHYKNDPLHQPNISLSMNTMHFKRRRVDEAKDFEKKRLEAITNSIMTGPVGEAALRQMKVVKLRMMLCYKLKRVMTGPNTPNVWDHRGIHSVTIRDTSHQILFDVASVKQLMVAYMDKMMMTMERKHRLPFGPFQKRYAGRRKEPSC